MTPNHRAEAVPRMIIAHSASVPHLKGYDERS